MQCVNDCGFEHGHGKCQNGRCYCADGYGGEGCSDLVCSNACSGHGKNFRYREDEKTKTRGEDVLDLIIIVEELFFIYLFILSWLIVSSVKFNIL